MNTIETIRTFQRCNFTITVKAVEDCDVDLSFDETGEVAKQLDRGDLIAFGVIVTVYLRGSEVGEDSLWGCIYRSPREFMDHFGIKHSGYGSYFSDMVHGAIAEARKTVASFKAVQLRK